MSHNWQHVTKNYSANIKRFQFCWLQLVGPTGRMSDARCSASLGDSDSNDNAIRLIVRHICRTEKYAQMRFKTLFWRRFLQTYYTAAQPATGWMLLASWRRGTMPSPGMAMDAVNKSQCQTDKSAYFICILLGWLYHAPRFEKPFASKNAIRMTKKRGKQQQQ